MSKKKTTGKFTAKKKKSGKGLITALIIAAILLAAFAALFLFQTPDKQADQIPGEPAETTGTVSRPEVETTLPAPLTEVKNSVNLGYGIYVTDIGPYTGMYMEDGTDEIVSGVLMLVVQNNGEQDIQYAEITMDIGEEQASFSVTTLPVGESMVLLEKNRMAWDETVDYSAILPKVENIAYFQEPISTLEEQLKIQIVDGAINVTNISEEDITGTITIYYKNAAADLLYGGITYRISMEGGLTSGEIRQVMTNHASDTGSRIMFATIVQ